VNAEIMPTGGFTIEADAHINIKLIAIRGHKVVATRRSESQVVYTVERVVDEDIQIEPGS
jgi:hypothetical protein